MTRTTKKYNIWVAYSDLFTNLSTFLFISAVGIFAGIGSGVLDSPGAGGSTHCNVPPGIDKSLRADGSLLTPLGPDLERCSAYYRIADYRFRSALPAIGEFKGRGGKMPQSDMLRKLCQPIWLTVTRKDFVASKGRIIFQGIADPENGWAYQPQCRAVARDEPRVRGFPLSHSASLVIHECEGANGLAAFPAVCPLIEECKSKSEDHRSGFCREVAAVREWEIYAEAACRRQVAQRQAMTIHELCDTAPGQPSFRDDLFEGEQIDTRARRVDMRPQFWEKVDYGVPFGGTVKLAQPSRGRRAEAPAGGAVIVEVRYGR